MLYAILAYHVEEEVTSWTPREDAALMVDLNKVHDRLNREGRMGPAARLGATKGACVLRGPGSGVVTDGPFTESKKQLLGFRAADVLQHEQGPCDPEAFGRARRLLPRFEKLLHPPAGLQRRTPG